MKGVSIMTANEAFDQNKFMIKESEVIAINMKEIKKEAILRCAWVTFSACFLMTICIVY